jgi:glycosyltransferase involved in cell wall biosynthesis
MAMDLKKGQLISRPTVSVCMATYNGLNHINEQLESILQQLKPNDEVIISDDHSTDGTWEWLKIQAANDGRIILTRNPKKGVITNYHQAIRKSSKDIIFLSDQDDVWRPNKVDLVVQAFVMNPGKTVVVSDLQIVDEQLVELEPSYFKLRDVGEGFLRNLRKSGYIGASMAFRDELKKMILPIPPNVPMHDMWIGLLADYHKEVLFLPVVTGMYRRHGDNVTALQSKQSKFRQATWRITILYLVAKRLLRRHNV